MKILRALLCVATWIAPTLSKHIADVIGVATEKQMSGIDAGRIIAMMTDFHALWNGAVSQFPCDAMRERAFAPDSSRAVTVISFATLPFPALIGVEEFDALPESDVPGRTARIVLGKKAVRMPLVNIFSGDLRLCDTGFATTPALALAIGMLQTILFHPGGKVQRIWFGFASEMTSNISNRLAFYMSPFAICRLGDWGKLSATAMAITVGNVARGMIGVHENLHSLAKPRDDSTHRRGNFIGRYSFIIPQGGVL